MSMEKIRSEFEAWALTHFINSDSMHPLVRDEEDPDEYRYSRVNMAWVAWQASRESLVIELKADIKSMAGPLMYADDVRAAIEVSGLKHEVRP